MCPRASTFAAALHAPAASADESGDTAPPRAPARSSVRGRTLRSSAWLRRPALRGVAALVAVAALTVAYVVRADEHGRALNTNPQAYDQTAYMHFAEKMQASGYRYLTDGARGPAYPFVLSLIYRPGMSEAAFFAAGRRLGIALSLAALAVLGLMLIRLLPRHTAINMLLISAFTVFVFRAAYVQPELPFYVAFFAAFYLACRAIAAPSASLGLGAGACFGLAHLLKPSALPALVLFVACVALAGILGIVRSGRETAGSRSPTARLDPRPFYAAALALFGFAVVIGPYAIANRRVFGDWLYNVNTTFYMWYDSWDEVKQGTRAHGDRQGWPDMPTSELPSPLRYLREHSVRQIALRLRGGVIRVARESVGSYGYAKYAVVYGLFAAACVMAQRRRALLLARENAPLVLFGASFFALYALFFAWFGPINYGERLVLSLYLPWLYSMAFITVAIPLPWSVPWHGRRVPLPAVLESAVTVVVLVDMVAILAGRIMSMPAGT